MGSPHDPSEPVVPRGPAPIPIKPGRRPSNRELLGGKQRGVPRAEGSAGGTDPRPLPMIETPKHDLALLQLSQYDEAAGTGKSVGEFREPDEYMPGAMLLMAGRATEEEHPREPDVLLHPDDPAYPREAPYEKSWLHGLTEWRLRWGFTTAGALIGAVIGWVQGGRAAALARNLRM